MVDKCKMVDKYTFPNPDNNPWIDKYNALVLEVAKHEAENIQKKKTQPKRDDKNPLWYSTAIGIHHIIPKKVDMSLVKDKRNLLYIGIADHCTLHYYLWRANPDYAPHLAFIGRAGEKFDWWHMPGGQEEWKQLYKDAAAYSKKKREAKKSNQNEC